LIEHAVTWRSTLKAAARSNLALLIGRADVDGSPVRTPSVLPPWCPAG